MLVTFLRRILPLLILGSLTLSSCVVHERRPPRDRGYHDRGPGRGPGRGPENGPGRY